MHRSARALSVAVLSATALSTTVLSAAALSGPAPIGDGPSARVGPRAVDPDGSTTVSVSCTPAGGPLPETVEAYSEAFAGGTARLHRVPGRDDTAGPAYRGSARIAPAGDLATGRGPEEGGSSAWSVLGTCPAGPDGHGERWNTTVTVFPRGDRHGGGTRGEVRGTLLRAGTGEPYGDDPGAESPPDEGAYEGGGDPHAEGMDDGADPGEDSHGGDGREEGAHREDPHDSQGSHEHGHEHEHEHEQAESRGEGDREGEGEGEGDSEREGDREREGGSGRDRDPHDGDSHLPVTDPPAMDRGVRAGEGGAFTDSVPALAAGGLLVAGAVGAAVQRLRPRRRGRSAHR
ncbi:hypothetical protein GCM10010145_16030 [Streptomyces ruber]|uniref:Secreted protein n=2 Tax=Streptomyces TaxID=1883 RepID=A0A918B951_9ACTN|nr:hypothetical protein [Streptomyces ruber]GGQ47725.1 hypothetical protein GCM10010145_16030 [Streptomyces ruber]